MLGLVAARRLSLVVESRGYSPVSGLLIAIAFLVAVCTWDFSHCSTQAGGREGIWASVVLVHGLRYSVAWGCDIFLNKGSNAGLLYWQVDSYPL